jgi:tetratricopeptide (TPR) repeat protein
MRASHEERLQRYNIIWRLPTEEAPQRRAIEDYDEALRLDPGWADAYYVRARALYLVGSNTEALDDVDRSLSLRPGDPAIIDTRAHVLAALGRRNEALSEFERVMRVGGADWVRTYQEALAKHGYYRGAIYGGGLQAADPGGAGCLSGRRVPVAGVTRGVNAAVRNVLRVRREMRWRWAAS